jgi:hypothetical protein
MCVLFDSGFMGGVIQTLSDRPLLETCLNTVHFAGHIIRLELEFKSPRALNCSSCRVLARFAQRLFRYAQHYKGASPPSLSPELFFALKLSGGTIYINTYGKA